MGVNNNYKDTVQDREVAIYCFDNQNSQKIDKPEEK